MDVFEQFLAVAIAATVIFIVALLSKKIYKIIYYRYEYSKVKTIKATVVGMDYTPPRSQFNYSTKTTTTTPAMHEVHLLTANNDKYEFDDEYLYQAVRLDDEVEVYYQKVRKYHKKRPRIKIECEDHIVAVKTIKGRLIQLGDEEKPSY